MMKSVVEVENSVGYQTRSAEATIEGLAFPTPFSREPGWRGCLSLDGAKKNPGEGKKREFKRKSRRGEFRSHREKGVGNGVKNLNGREADCG